MRIYCKYCDQRYHHSDFPTHKCARRPKADIPPDIDKALMADYEKAKLQDRFVDTASVKRNLRDVVGVRMSDNLLQRLDKARGGMTRPAKIREILEENL